MNTIQNIARFFNEGGWFMYPLALCSIILVAAVVHRMINIRSSRIAPPALMAMAEKCIAGGESTDRLLRSVQGGRSPLARLIRFVLESETTDAESLSKMVEVKAREEFVRLQSGLPLLDMIIMIAPMFGILGTASGLVIVFSVFGMDDNSGNIARGIANALNTTIAGLAIATPAVIANVCFARQMERVSSSMEVVISELVARRFVQ